MSAADRQPTWDEVLASFEATADAAEALLHPVVEGDPPPPAEVPAAARLEYDPWQLALPPLPAALVARARAVHERHEQLAARLQRSCTALRQQEQYVRTSTTGPAASVGHPRSVFVDQQA